MTDVTATKKGTRHRLAPLGSAFAWLVNRPLKIFISGLFAVVLGHVLMSFGAGNDAHPSSELSWAHFGELVGWIVQSILSPHFVGELLRELGFALWVAAAIAVLIEYNSVLHDSSSVLANFLKSDLPKDWFDYLVQQIRSQKLHRPTQLVEYVFEVPTAEDAAKSDRPFLIYTATTSYEIRNLSRTEAVRWPVRLGVERPWDHALDGLVSVEQVKIDDVSLTRKEIDQALSNWTDTPSAMRLLLERILPVGASAKVRLRFKGVMYTRDTTTYTFRDTSDSITMNVRTPPGYVASLVAHHSSSRAGPVLCTSVGSREWEVALRVPCMPPTVFELSVSEERFAIGKI